MAYERQSFKNGQVLKAEHLKCIEDCLCDMSPVADSFKFSPDCVGKTIRVAAVDENGKPTAWKVVDLPSGVGGNGLSVEQRDALHEMFKVAAYTEDASDAYAVFKAAFGIGSEEEPDVPDDPEAPDEPEKTLTSISAVYSGGSVTAGTSVNALTGIVVTAHYSDGTSASVTGYTLSGTIAEGSNTITVSYGGKSTTFTVTGIAEESNLEQYEYTIVGNGLLNNNGGIQNNGAYQYTDFITVDPDYDSLTVEVYIDDIKDVNLDVYLYIQWFNGDEFISRPVINTARIFTGDLKTLRLVPVVEGATRFRISVQNNCSGFSIFKGTVDGAKE